MLRKVIQIAESTQLISLPRKWALKNQVKKGDDLSIIEQGSALLVSTNKNVELESIEIDISKLDRTSLIYCIQSLYRLGYDEIKVNFDRMTIQDLRYNKTVNLISILQYIVNRLSGFEIVQQTTRMCHIKNIQDIKDKDLDIVLKRVFVIWQDCFSHLIEGMTEKRMDMIEAIEDLHDSITRFVSFCLRAINKRSTIKDNKTYVLYHIISNIDKSVDVVKHAARDIIKYNIQFKKEELKILDNINQAIKDYANLFYTFKLELVHTISDNRIKTKQQIRQMIKKVPLHHVLLLDNLRFILELLLDLVEARWGLEY